LTKNDPLFYSSFFDSEGFTESLEGLKASENQLKKVMEDNLKQDSMQAKSSDKNSYLKILKENDLFPYQFLQNLILINQKTNEFLKNPSTKLGQKLLSLYDNAADYYIKDVEAKINILKNNKSKNECFLFFIDSFSSCKIVENDLLVIKENGYKLKEEIAQRKNCFSGKNNCKSLLKTNKNNSFNTFMESIESGNFDLKSEKIDLIRRVLPYYINFPNQNKIRGPYRINSACWKNPKSEQWIFLAYQTRKNKTLMLSKLATQNYYWKVEAENPTLPLNKILLEKGIPFYFQMETATYECPDLTFYPQLLTLDFLKKQMESEKITKKDLEKKLEYKLLIENQFGLLPSAINVVSDQLGTLKLYLSLNHNILPLSFLFSTRTAYSIFYFPYAKSVWRIDKQLQYFAPEKEKPLTGLLEVTTLDELVKLGYTEAEIKRFFIPIVSEDFYDFLFPKTKL